MKKIFLLMGLLLQPIFPAEALVIIEDVYRDGYVEDFTRLENVDPDGIPDRINDTNSLLSARGKAFDQFNSINYDLHSIITFDISAYSGMQLFSAKFSAYGRRADAGTSTDPISGQFYLYAGNGLVELNDFSGPAEFLGDATFTPNPPFSSDLDFFELDATAALQALLDHSDSFAEFRVESEQKTAYINAGESFNFPLDQRWPGPRLTLTFDESAVVAEPATAMLFAAGVAGGIFKRRRKSAFNSNHK
jgi:hypothetical protein